MNTALQPLVSVLTPVYNEAEFLAECIESVLAQTYTSWDYTIIDNCSSDESLAVAQSYAARDHRIRVVRNERFLPIIQNHNNAIRQISPASKYCKFVFADDWLYATCIEEMVRTAEENPGVGLVGAYTTDGRGVLWPGPQYPAGRVSGRDVCRGMLLGGPYVLGPMTSLLVRSDLVRKRAVFFNERHLHADTEACFDILQESDYGYVHQVLSFSRPRHGSAGSFASDFNSIELGIFLVFLKYGPVCLERGEHRRRWKEVQREYHRVLAHNVLRIRGRDFWEYHERTLAVFGSRINRRLVIGLVMAELLASLLLRPISTIRHGWRWWSRALRSKASENREIQIQRLA